MMKPLKARLLTILCLSCVSFIPAALANEVTVWWKPATAATVATDVANLTKTLAATHVIICPSLNYTMTRFV